MARPSTRAVAFGLGALALSSCGRPAPRVTETTDPGHLVASSVGTFAVPGYPDREYILRVPRGYDGHTPLPVVFGFHGGGGKKENFVRIGCPDGDADAPSCLSALADREGFALVMPDGSKARGHHGRGWNAGGGVGEFRCSRGVSCRDGVDDVGYVDALYTEVKRAIAVDPSRVYAIGISNGGAMSHRLACERSPMFAAIATVGGEDQSLAAPGCEPSTPVPVLAIHGTEDPCWGYDGLIREPFCRDGTDTRFVSVKESVDGWLRHNRCATPSLEAMRAEPLPDLTPDGTQAVWLVGEGCAAETVHIRIDGGGHTWPGGYGFLSERRIGRVSRDFDGNAVIWAFLSQHRR